jgi:hypothetical protein
MECNMTKKVRSKKIHLKHVVVGPFNNAKSYKMGTIISIALTNNLRHRGTTWGNS